MKTSALLITVVVMLHCAALGALFFIQGCGTTARTGTPPPATTTPMPPTTKEAVNYPPPKPAEKAPVAALNFVADALPGLGIVAAVLGIVITMQAIGGAPELVGQKVAAALVGTFLGILLCYGVVSPIAARVEKLADRMARYFLPVVEVAALATLVIGYFAGWPDV